MATAVLIIEDEAILAKNMATYLGRHGFEARRVGSGEAGLAELDSYKPDIVLLDYHLPGMSGLEALARIRQCDEQIKVIMITGQGSVQTAVDAMKAGAYDYLTKPVALSELKLLLERAAGQERTERAISYYQRREAQENGLARLIGASPPMQALRATVGQLLEAEHKLEDGGAPAVLIIGETGTGKELVARAVHFDGRRRAQPFIEINCASIPAQLLEAELFGYERGAFTDARSRKLGLAEAADGGTLFLDEVGDADLAVQAKLLKLLEEKSVRRLGSVRDLKVDVRIVAATNRPLEELVRERRFRSDLFFRLRGVQITVPPLRARGDDILVLARHFLALHAARYGKKSLRLSMEAERALRGYSWPGNVRELRSVLEQSVLLAVTDAIGAEHLSLCTSLGAVEAGPGDTAGREIREIPSAGIDLEQVERDLVLQALERTGWNVTRAARLLGLSRDTLRYRIEKYQLSPVRQGAAGLNR
ncbi:MAG TPA: sigma-54 dependent transcriptional regulator [Burkholderiales bacterium]|nr:sigma-54 dependent transcriptional regulator [Burkholderiales bacterium]